MVVHRNALLYRIKRIQKLTGLDLLNPSTRAWSTSRPCGPGSILHRPQWSNDGSATTTRGAYLYEHIRRTLGGHHRRCERHRLGHRRRVRAPGSPSGARRRRSARAGPGRVAVARRRG
ncbi:hypothetical protein BST25_01295 [Mycobacterium heidelbergense]|uniref:PucR C-terminal helix-turn-helix domain-containing protein n=1 Tax=Mycobacterium heidelbergense TaxID=53376 RepID=A0A1X0DV63_MYCHE|nr:hypothetical protein BST25_01295 [Mycobacterium heidelbergense]